MQSKCADCGIIKSWLEREQKAKGLLSNLGIKTPLSKIPLLNVLFWMQFHWVYKIQWNRKQMFTGRLKIYAINEFKATWFIYSAFFPLKKKKEKIEKFIPT